MSKTDEVWKGLELYFKEFPHDMAGECSSSELLQAQETLGAQFHKSYRKFVMQYGGGIVGSKVIYGLRHQKDMGDNFYSVVDLTNFYRNQHWPYIGEWYVVSDDFDGNPIGIDPDGKVWLLDHDSGFEKVKLADSFEEFLYKLLTDTLYEE